MRTRDLIVALALLFGCSHKAAPVEVAHEASPAAAPGAKPAEAQVTQTSGEKIALAEVLHQHAQNIVVFYRGFW
jgi:uncharacterized protein YcfL